MSFKPNIQPKKNSVKRKKLAVVSDDEEPQTVDERETQDSPPSASSSSLPTGPTPSTTSVEHPLPKAAVVHSSGGPIADIDNPGLWENAAKTLLSLQKSHESLTEETAEETDVSQAPASEDAAVPEETSKSKKKLRAPGEKLIIADYIRFNPKENSMKSKERNPPGRPKKSTKKDNVVEAHESEETETTSTALVPASQPQPEEPSLVIAPQVKIGANGQLIIDQSSLVQQSVEETVEEDRTLVINDRKHNPYHTKQTPSVKWSKEETDTFYYGLSCCGTNFDLISRFFPNRDQRQIKNKFNREDKANREAVDYALKHRVPLDASRFCKK